MLCIKRSKVSLRESPSLMNYAFLRLWLRVGFSKYLTGYFLRSQNWTFGEGQNGGPCWAEDWWFNYFSERGRCNLCPKHLNLHQNEVRAHLFLIKAHLDIYFLIPSFVVSCSVLTCVLALLPYTDSFALSQRTVAPEILCVPILIEIVYTYVWCKLLFA